MLKKMFKRQAYYCASAVFLFLSMIYFLAVIHQPYIGLSIKNVDGQWIVSASDSWGQGYCSGIRVGNVVLKINQGDPGQASSVQRWGEVEGVSTLEVHKQSQAGNQIIHISKSPVWKTIVSDITFGILGIVFWLLGFMAWRKRPFLPQARALFWLNWAIGLAFASAPASSRGLLLAKELELISFATVPIFLINFISLLQNKTINRINRLMCRILILMSAIILIMIILRFMGVIQSIRTTRKLTLLILIMGSFLVILNLISLLKLPKDKPEKNQVNIFLLSIIIGFLPFIFLSAIPIIFEIDPINAHITALFMSVIPVGWYYVIVNKCLPDGRELIGTIISYLLPGIIMSLAVSYLFFVLKVSTTFDLVLYLLTLILMMVFIFCFSLIRVAINRFLKNYLFSDEKLALKQRVLELNQSITSINGEEQILQEVANRLGIEGVFTIIDDGRGNYIKKGEGLFSITPSEQIKLEEFYQADQKMSSEARLLSDDLPAEIYSLYKASEFRCGIFLGHRFSHIKFERDELPLITLILNQLAQRLITTAVIKELSKEMENIAREYYGPGGEPEPRKQPGKQDRKRNQRIGKNDLECGY